MSLSASFLVDLVRRLMIGGNAIYLIDVDPAGSINLRPASDFKVSGSARRLSYQLELPSPSPTGQPVLRRASADGVVHITVNETSGAPWIGRAPWQCANLSAESLGMIERSLRSDSSIPGGQLLPIPDGASRTAKDAIANALSKGQGAISPIETTAGGYGAGHLAAPRDDYDQKRFGATVPEANLKMRDSTSLAILRSYGVSEKIWSGDGNAMIQSRRELFLDVVEPLGVLVAQELSLKLDSNITLDFTRSNYKDHQRNSRALKTYIDAGLSLAQAAAIIGINLNESATPTLRDEHTPTSAGAGRQAAAVVDGNLNQSVNGEVKEEGTPLDTPQVSPPVTPTITPTGLRVKHKVGDLVVGEHASTEVCLLCRTHGVGRGHSTNGHIEHATLSWD